MPERVVANPLTRPSRLPLVAPSILAADFAHLADECRACLDAGADLLHLDVMDGHFVPNLTMGPALCRSLRREFPDVALDVHLMVTDPAIYVQPFEEAGATHLTFHVEAVPEPADLAHEIRSRGMTAGLAINPPTDVGRIIPWIEWFDVILIMSVNPGFAGQAFIADVLEKAGVVRPTLDDNQRLEIDGGVGPETAGDARAAGCDVLVAASAVFGADDYRQAINEIRGDVSSPLTESPCRS